MKVMPFFCDLQYLQYFLKKNKLSVDDYNLFHESCLSQSIKDFTNDLENNSCINIRPYLYTISKQSLNEYFKFLTFYKCYLRKSDLMTDHEYNNIIHNIDEDPQNNLDTLVKLIRTNKVLMLTLLYTMQYYFV